MLVIYVEVLQILSAHFGSFLVLEDCFLAEQAISK